MSCLWISNCKYNIYACTIYTCMSLICTHSRVLIGVDLNDYIRMLFQTCIYASKHTRYFLDVLFPINRHKNCSGSTKITCSLTRIVLIHGVKNDFSQTEGEWDLAHNNLQGLTGLSYLPFLTLILIKLGWHSPNAYLFMKMSEVLGFQGGFCEVRSVGYVHSCLHRSIVITADAQRYIWSNLGKIRHFLLHPTMFSKKSHFLQKICKKQSGFSGISFILSRSGLEALILFIFLKVKLIWLYLAVQALKNKVFAFNTSKSNLNPSRDRSQDLYQNRRVRNVFIYKHHSFYPLSLHNAISNSKQLPICAGH
ncbi:hypothetical protein EGR_11213 [Echinococcus granulosus]|uniref:Uncharacterized protein n=1 Tax=Echinococcus granulosus TaxID=6210 RepID=W6TYR8_ECHGR|nr:hypothetical protein EGR_11213 [Echinococcus granulosus]EUB53930.1 hypothetical protein EGR_11213 [Echinococcus granulosus]